MGAAGTPTYRPIGAGGGGGGVPCSAAPALLCLAGRTGTTNNPTISTDSDGVIHGSLDATKSLMLASSPSLSPPQLTIRANGLGLDQLIIGEGPDPTSSLVPGGLLQFLITADEAISGLPAVFAAYSLNGGFNNGATFFGIGANGSFVTPTASLDGDNLLKIACLGFDATNTLVGNPPPAAMIFLIDGDPITGVTPGQLLLGTTDSAGNAPTRLWIRSNGNIGIGDDMHDPVGRFHIRNEDPSTIASIFMGHQSQTANLTDWDKKVVTTVSVNANPGDTTITVTDSTGLFSSGTVFIDTAHPIYRFRSYAYSANNTGTGVLTLVGTVITAFTAGSLVYQPHPMTSVDPAGNILLLGGDTTGTRGYVEVGTFDSTTPTNDAPAPAAGKWRIYARDNGGGKTQAVIRFNTGAVQVIATQP